MLYADLILNDANVLSPNVSIYEHKSIAIKYGLIMDIDEKNELSALIGPKTRVIDLKGKTVIPGFIDAHTHFLSMGVRKLSLDLSSASSLKEVLDLIESQSKKLREGQWIIGYGWDESKWPEHRYITAEDLDSVTSKHPVFLTRIDGHMGTLNSLALKILNLDNNPNVKNGIIKEEYLEKVRSFLVPTQEDIKKGLILAFQEAAKNGVTSVHDNVGKKYLRTYLQEYSMSDFPISIYLLLWKDLLPSVLPSEFRTNFGSEMLKIGSIKLMIDGSVGARTAAFFEPYYDDPTTSGMLVLSEDEIYDIIINAHVNGFQLAVHVIGDKAIDIALDAFKEAYRKKQTKDLRHRLEHVEFPTEDQIKEIKKLNLIASMQPNFVGNWSQPDGMYFKRLGKERWMRNNPYRQLWDYGVTVAFGSDCMPFGPLYGLHFAVNHFVNENALSVEEAIQCYTYNSAYAGFSEEYAGSIASGKYANLVALSMDPIKNSKKIKEIVPLLTISRGKIIYSKL